MRVKHIAVVCTALFVSAGVHAFDMNDCILNGMKGVANETAAREIKNACRQKSQDENRKVLDKVLNEYGDVIDDDSIKRETFGNSGEVQYRNSSEDKVITFLRLAVWPVSNHPDELCKSGAMRAYNFKLTLKPGKTVKLTYPSKASTDCVKTWVVFGRGGNWKDVSLLSSANPIDSMPFDERVFNLSTLFGQPPTPPYLPRPSGNAAKGTHAAGSWMDPVDLKNPQNHIYSSLDMVPMRSLARAMRESK